MSLTKRTVTLSNDVEMPWVGLGTWDQGPAAISAALAAFASGYRMIDTGSFYQNEEDLGRAIAQTDVPRDEIFLTTKVWNSEQGYDATLRSFDVSAQKLGLDVIDLYLVHWPVQGKSADTWRALERLYAEKRVRAIGVSNFEIHHLEDLFRTATVIPMVNQIDLHPMKTSKQLLEFCKARAIQVEAWAPLAQNKVFAEPKLKQIAESHGRTVAQIVLRWHLQNGVAVIPKSQNPARIRENIDLFDFSLDDQTMAAIDAMNTDLNLLGFTPDTIPAVLLQPPAQPWPYSL